MEEEWMLQMREKMADYKWPAPELSWDELDLALAAGTTHKIHLLWMRRMVAAAVILLIAGVGYWGLLRHKTEPIVEKHWAQKQPIENRSSQGDRNDVTSQTSHVFFDKRIGRAERLSPCDLKKTKLEHHSTAMSEPEVVPISMGDYDTINTTETIEKEQPHALEEKEKPTKEILPIISPSELHQRKYLDHRLTAKAYVTSTMTGNLSESYRKPDVYILGVLSRYPSYPNPSYSNSSYPNLIVTTEHYVHHRQPMRFGLLLRYRLTDHWSLESGLSYTRLSSDITTIILNETTVTEQRLNYIGLPLNISYELWKSRYFGLYVTGGGTIEKCLDANPWQFSLNGAAGAEYKLTNFFSLYAEPGIGYYFKDGSSTPTIYKDHPLNFNLSLGLRFNLR